MDIKHIITFIKVAELKSFTKAAKELKYAQSTISFQVRSLEYELGIQLFERKHKNLYITKQGQLILNICKQLRDDYFELLDTSSKIKSSAEPIQIASSGSFLIYRLSKIFKLFKVTYPSVSIQLNNSPSCQYSKLIKENVIDLAFFVDPNIVDDSIELIHLNREPMYLIYPPSYEFIDYKHLAADLTTCIPKIGCSYGQILSDFHNDMLLKPSTTIEALSIEMIKKCVSSDIGYSILPKMCITEELKNHTFQSILLDSSKYYIDLTVGYRKDRLFPLHITHLIDIIREESNRDDL